MEGKAAFPQAIKRPYAGNRISRESGTSDTAEKRENEMFVGETRGLDLKKVTGTEWDKPKKIKEETQEGE